MLAPFRDVAPHVEAGRGRAHAVVRDDAENVEHRLAPGPAAAGHRLRGQPRAARRGILRQLGEQPHRRAPQRARRLGEAFGQVEVERAGQAARRRHAERRRAHEGEQLQQVERGEGIDTEPAGRRRRMAEQRPRARVNSRRGFAPVDLLDLAVRREPDGARYPDGERRCVRQAYGGAGRHGRAS
jgi:hypothetical protein